MRIVVHARAGAKMEKVEPVGGSEGIFKVWVKEPAVDGKANHAIVKALAMHFKVSVTQVTLTSGATAKIKRFTIET